MISYQNPLDFGLERASLRPRFCRWDCGEKTPGILGFFCGTAFFFLGLSFFWGKNLRENSIPEKKASTKNPRIPRIISPQFLSKELKNAIHNTKHYHVLLIYNAKHHCILKSTQNVYYFNFSYKNDTFFKKSCQNRSKMIHFLTRNQGFYLICSHMCIGDMGCT